MSEAGTSVRLAGLNVKTLFFNTVVVGSGAAGLNAADHLWSNGRKSLALLTEGVAFGTSRNTGSDKQTYYKLTTSGEGGDSVRGMAATLFAGGAVDGDTALAEAALSARCFFRLVDIGVPFPHNAGGEYVGYKTDHDPFRRGTSAGPLTSKFMTERLLEQVVAKGIPLYERLQAIELVVGDGRVMGVLALDLEHLADPDRRYVLFAAANVIYATGGEAGMYEASVYPPAQTGSTGLAFRAGAPGKNLTESQFGIASTAFRWNLSGTYQQTLPRYISTNRDGGDAREFLDPFFAGPAKLLTAIFLKGYQWPFDPRKVAGGGSSLIDILVHNETQCNNRRVFLDYTRNPSCAEKGGSLDFSLLEPEVRDYLANSDALLATPFERLRRMNPGAVELYRSHGIDLAGELLEIAVCAQHNNGGLAGDMWWQSPLPGLFPIGEVNGSHGVYRPGGSALNAGQVGGVRAGQYILANRNEPPAGTETLLRAAGAGIEKAIAYGEGALRRNASATDLAGELAALRRRMTCYGAHIRSLREIVPALEEAKRQLDRLENEPAIESPAQLRSLHQLRDMVLCQYVYLFAIKDYMERGGGGRGSYLVQDPNGLEPAAHLPETFRYRLDDGTLAARVQEITYKDGACAVAWRDVRPIPAEDDWFESVWRRYDSGAVFGCGGK